MELKEGRIGINRKEMAQIKKMDHRQLEQKLSEAMILGVAEGEKHADKMAVRQTMEESNRKWQQAVNASLESLKGIGQKRKELFTEYLKENLREAGICIK